jgi:hypothetical protein
MITISRAGFLGSAPTDFAFWAGMASYVLTEEYVFERAYLFVIQGFVWG